MRRRGVPSVRGLVVVRGLVIVVLLVVLVVVLAALVLVYAAATRDHELPASFLHHVFGPVVGGGVLVHWLRAREGGRASKRAPELGAVRAGRLTRGDVSTPRRSRIEGGKADPS